MWRFALAFLLLAPASAHADASSFVAALKAVYAWISTYGVYVAAAYTVYSGVQARSAARKAERKAKEEYNAGLQERLVTALNEAPAERYVYGSGLFGGDVVAIFSSDKTQEDGSIKPDGYKHLVIVVASHRIKAIKDVLIDGIRLGITGTTGWATASEFAKGSSSTDQTTAAGNLTSVTLTSYSVSGRIVGALLNPGIISVSAVKGETVLPVPSSDYSLSGAVLTLPSVVSGITMDATWTWQIDYNFIGGSLSTVFASKFLGTSAQTADAYLMGKVPGQWLTTDRLQGRAGLVVTLDLTEPRFQSGIPNLLFDLDGNDEIYDPRDATTKYTNNAALVLDDYLRRRLGVIPNVAATIEASNASDVSTTFLLQTYPPDGVGPPTPSTTVGGRYTINGAFSDASDKEQTLTDLARAMAGKVVHGADWRILAGAWTPPVAAIVDGDDMGPVQILQAGEAIDEIFNGVRGTFIPAGESAISDFNPPYQNSTFVTADGEELWEDVTLPFTDHPARARNIARIMTELSRNGLIIVYPAKIRHWELQVGQRVTVTNAEYGWTAKTFQIINWDFNLDGAVLLTLQEDNEEAYDLSDAALVDPTPNTGLPSPMLVPEITGLTLAASTSELLRLADGTIVPRVRATWTASTAAYMENGYVEVAWQVPRLDTLNWNVQNAGGRDTEVLIEGVREGTIVTVRLTAVNSIGVRSVSTFAAIYVLGKAANPTAVSGLSASIVPGAVLVTWTPSAELDYLRTELRYGASYAAGTRLAGVGDNRSHTWPWPAAGAYTIWAVNYDTTGHESTPVSTTVTVDASAVGGFAGNLIPNSDQTAAMTWDDNQQTVGVTMDAPVLQWSSNIFGPDYILQSATTRNLVAHQSNIVAGGNAVPAWDFYPMGGWGADFCVPVEPEQWYCLASYFQAHRCDGGGGISWFDVDGNFLSNSEMPRTAVPYNLASSLALYARPFVIAKPPAGAVRACPYLRKYNTWTGDAESYYWPAAPQMCPVAQGTTAPPPYLPGIIGALGQLDPTLRADLTEAQADASAAISAAATAQATADGKVVTFVQTSAPTAEGVGDLWVDSDDANKLYRWDGSSWVAIRDTGIATALTDASNAQATADGKIVSFYASSAPTATAVGDLWIDTDDDNKQYRWSGSSWVSIRDAGIAAAISAAATAQATADGKIDSFYQTSAPGTASEGDIWFDTDDGNKQYVRISGVWVLAADTRIGQAISDAAGAQATADGKVTTFYASSAPTATAVGDLWFNTTAGSTRVSRWSGSAWVTQSVLGSGDVGTGEIAADAATEVLLRTYTLFNISPSDSAAVTVITENLSLGLFEVTVSARVLVTVSAGPNTFRILLGSTGTVTVTGRPSVELSAASGTVGYITLTGTVVVECTGSGPWTLPVSVDFDTLAGGGGTTFGASALIDNLTLRSTKIKR